MEKHPEVMLAKRKHADYAPDMAPNILIRDVPGSVHSVMVARAQAEGMSLQEYLLGTLTDLAGTPSMADIVAEIEVALGDPNRPRLSSEEIVTMVRADRDAHDWTS